MSDNTFYREIKIEGRNAVLEALRSGRDIDRILVMEGLENDSREKKNPVAACLSLAKKNHVYVKYEKKEVLDDLSETGKHQGIMAFVAEYKYSEVSDLLEIAKNKNEPPFFILLDGITDPHNLGAILRTANLAGAHGLIIPKRRAAGLTATVAKTSAGAINYTPVALVSNMAATIEKLKNEGMWFVCADMGGTCMYDLNLTGPIGLVIGSEGEGVSRIVREKCDMIASIPMKGDIDSLNASVAAGVLAYEIVRQRGVS